MDNNENMIDYFSGKKLYGDDFNLTEIKNWYNDEKEAYANLSDLKDYKYVYHNLNIYHGFRFLSNKEYNNVLGFGSAFGDEFKPIADKIKSLTIIESSDKFIQDSIFNIRVSYIKPSLKNRIPFSDNSFDLITCLGVLHHIPNVSYVINEFFRCTAHRGFVLIREPIFSMGDWTKSRTKLTRHERGIPLHFFRKIILNAGFTILKERLCFFPLIPKLYNFLGKNTYNSSFATYVDYILSNLFKFNLAYHAKNFFKKFRPTSVFYVLLKNILYPQK